MVVRVDVPEPPGPRRRHPPRRATRYPGSRSSELRRRPRPSRTAAGAPARRSGRTRPGPARPGGRRRGRSPASANASIASTCRSASGPQTTVFATSSSVTIAAAASKCDGSGSSCAERSLERRVRPDLERRLSCLALRLGPADGQLPVARLARPARRRRRPRAARARARSRRGRRRCGRRAPPPSGPPAATIDVDRLVGKRVEARVLDRVVASAVASSARPSRARA